MRLINFFALQLRENLPTWRGNSKSDRRTRAAQKIAHLQNRSALRLLNYFKISFTKESISVSSSERALRTAVRARPMA
jgi:hypothetical protein